MVSVCSLACRSGTNVLMGCRLCSQLDVFTPHMRELELSCPTTPRTWVVPCLCPSLVHRRCLETQLMMGRLQQLAPHGGRRGWISYDSAPLEVGRREGRQRTDRHAHRRAVRWREGGRGFRSAD